MTYRERRLRRAERLRGWAEKREADAARQLESQPELRHDLAFITQPGHIPERERMNRADDRAFRSLEKAESMASRADSIERAASHAIYSDDDDAVDALRARIASLEAERERIKAYNLAVRRDGLEAALATLDAKDRSSVELTLRYGQSRAGEMPAYVLSNLSGNISRQRARLARLEAASSQERD